MNAKCAKVTPRSPKHPVLQRPGCATDLTRRCPAPDQPGAERILIDLPHRVSITARGTTKFPLPQIPPDEMPFAAEANVEPLLPLIACVGRTLTIVYGRRRTWLGRVRPVKSHVRGTVKASARKFVASARNKSDNHTLRRALEV